MKEEVRVMVERKMGLMVALKEAEMVLEKVVVGVLDDEGEEDKGKEEGGREEEVKVV